MKLKYAPLKYQRVEAEIRQLTQALPVGAKIPAERELAFSYKCNFLTVRKALKQLVDDGTVVRRIGSGTFIARPWSDNTAATTKTENRIGILVYQQSNAYAYRVMQAIAHAGLEQGAELRSAWVRDFGRDSIDQANLLKKEGCVGLILPWFPHEELESVRALVQNGPLPVSLPLIIPGLEKNCFERQEVFGASSIESSEALCRYFYLLGHRRLAFIGPDTASDVILQKKLSAYVCYTARENLPNLCGLVPARAQAMDQLAERWKAYRGDLAVVGYDDEHALRFMTAMHKLGLSAPEDYVISGFNDTEGSRFSDPPLSTVRQNFDYIGHWLLKSALALSRGEVEQSSAVPPLQLKVRATCGGHTRLDETFRSRLHGLEIALDKNALENAVEAGPVTVPAAMTA